MRLLLKSSQTAGAINHLNIFSVIAAFLFCKNFIGGY